MTVLYPQVVDYNKQFCIHLLGFIKAYCLTIPGPPSHSRMLVQFGLMRDLIRRLQKYPVLGPTVDIEEAPPLPELQPLTEYVHLILYFLNMGCPRALSSGCNWKYNICM